MNKQQLANKIWESANKMRSKIEANEYKDYILGFIFYKFLSDKEEAEFIKQGLSNEELKLLTEDNKDIVTHSQDKLGYFISYENLFSTWLRMGSDFTAANVTDAISAFNRLIKTTHKNVFEKIFATLETGLSKLGESNNARTKSINDLIHLIKDIPMDGKQDYDVLGFIYEYLISNFAANAGKKAGEFYTPHEVSLLMSEIVAEHLKEKQEIAIYDPTSGSGSLLINIGNSVSKHIDDKNRIKYYAQELKENTYNLTRMNLVMRGILPDNILVRNGDTLEDDWPYFDENDKVSTYNPLYVEAVVSNPPYSQNWDPSGKENEPRYKEYGLAPKSKADYAFLLHDLFHVKPDGIMTIVLPHGVLFRGGEEGTIRTQLIEKNNIDTIIGLPANIFFGTGIPTIIMVLKQKRPNTDVLIIDASKEFVKEGKNNKLRACDIKKIADTVRDRISIPKYSKVVTREEIRNNDYNLNIPRYVDSSEKAESYDIYATMFGGIPKTEIDELDTYWNAFPNLKKILFDETLTPYTQLKTEDVKHEILNAPQVKAFVENYNKSFADLTQYLKTRLVDSPETVAVAKEETLIAQDIFERLNNIALVNKYEAYQILDDNWQIIYSDLEMIQTEGKETICKVEPKMVIKKKGNEENEVQEGWIGRIMPFDLIQSELLADDLIVLNKLKDSLSEISSNYEELLDCFDEEEKGSDEFSEEKDSFVNAAVSKKAKAIRLDIKKNISYDPDSYEMKIIKVADLIEKEKEIKKQIKEAEDDLTLKTIETIRTLSDEQINYLLEKKWIKPITDGISSMPINILDILVSRLKALSKKYAVTMKQTEEELISAEKNLSLMIDDLVGNEYDMAGLSELKKLLGGLE